MARTKNFIPSETLEKAVDLFWKQGFYATSMQNLVDCLGINRASMYDTYGSKEQLFAKALASYQEKDAKEVSAILYYYTNVRQGLYVLFEYLIDKSLNDQQSRSCFHVNSAIELANDNPEILASLKASREYHLKMYRTYLEYGLKNGQLSAQKDISSLAETLYTFQCGLMANSKLNPNKDGLMRSASEAIKLLD